MRVEPARDRKRQGGNVVLGGWTNIVEKHARAKSYCDTPFEVRRHGYRKVTVSAKGGWIRERRNEAPSRAVTIHCANSTVPEQPATGLDGCFSDPPYFGNVQYGEPMDF